MANVNKKSTTNNDNSKKNNKQNLNSRWTNKFNLDEMYDINPDEVKEKQKQEELRKKEEIKNKKHEENKIINHELQETINNAKSLKHIGFNMLDGVLAGSAFVLPTFSYGSVLANQKNNKKTITKLTKSFYDKPIKSWWWNLISILPMLFMWLITFVITYTIYAGVASVNYGPIFYFLSIGISISFIPLILLFKENSIPYSSKKIDEIKLKDPKWKWSIIIGAFLFLIVITFGLVIRFAWNNGTNENLLHISGFSTLSNNALINLGISNEISVEAINALSNTQQIIILLIGAMFSGFFTLIPGLSSGFGFALMGNYRLVNEALFVGFTGESISNFTNNQAWPIIIVAAIGYIVGFLGSMYLMSYLLNKNTRLFNSLSIWLLIGSIFASFIALSEYDYKFLGQNSIVLGISILFLILGMCACVPKIVIHYTKLHNQKNAAVK